MKKSVSADVSATQFRANLFDYLTQAKTGKKITVRHKGSAFQIVPLLPLSKLERLAALPPLDVIEGDWAEFEEASKKLSEDIQKAWEKKWDRRLGK